ncbi:MAG: PDZ domain-containing protein [Planctomycetes bacterium]|nr:PDZ domain-containing protein [Planctomycetota bacterium]
MWSGSRAAVILLVLTTPSSAAAAQERAEFCVDFSEKLDSAVFLNAISDKPRFNGPWKAVREVWRKKLAEDPAAAAAFERWGGRGIQLAYLLSALPEDDLEGVLRRFEEPEALVEAVREGLDESAYEPVFDDFRDHREEVRALLSFLRRSGFREMRRADFGAALESARKDLEEDLKAVDAERFVDLLEAFAGRKAPGRKLRIYALAFARPLSFQLSGFAIGWSSERETFARLLPHEFLHKFNPARDNVERLCRLGEEDAFYREAFGRIYGEFQEGKEEEFVDAAARCIGERLGLVSRARNLRSLKISYFSEATNRGGAPLVAVLLEELGGASIGPGFDYNAFIARALASEKLQAGRVEALYRRIIKPVGGMMGAAIEADKGGARVWRLLPGMPAELAGLSPGDVIAKIDGVEIAGKSREDMLDLLAGEPGRTIDLTVVRDGEARLVRVTLQ